MALSLRARAARASALLGAVVSVLFACTTPNVKEEKLCTPGKYFFCRCQDRREGAKLCNEDAKSYGPCEPCETYDNPEGPLFPGDPGTDRPIERDAGRRDGATAPSCGDGVVQDGEDCDDDNDDDDDGCDRSCKLAGATPPASNACPGLVVHVWGGAHAPSLAARTTGSGNRKASPSCSTGTATSGSSAPDRVFQVVAHATGTLTAALSETTFNAFLYASDACAPDANTWLACANETDGVGAETLSLDVEAGKTYWVFVDGTGTSAREGDFRVSFSIE